MSLTSLQVDQFHRDGFIAMEDVLTPLEISALYLRLQDIGNGVVDFPKQYIQVEPEVDKSEITTNPIRFNQIRKIWNLTQFDSLFQTYARPNALQATKNWFRKTTSSRFGVLDQYRSPQSYHLLDGINTCNNQQRMYAFYPGLT